MGAGDAATAQGGMRWGCGRGMVVVVGGGDGRAVRNFSRTKGEGRGTISAVGLLAGWLAVAVALVSHTSLLARGNFEGTRRRRYNCMTDLFAPAPDTYGADNDRLVDMDVVMTDETPGTTDTPQLLEEDALRHIARHVKSHIPGSTDANITEESL